MRECKSIFQRLKLSPNERLQTYVREHCLVDIEVEDTEYNEDNDDDSEKNEGDNLDEIAFPDGGFFDGTVAEVSVPMLTGGSIGGSHGGSGTVTGGDCGGIGYFSGAGSGGGSDSGLGSVSSSVDMSTTAVQAAAAGVT